MRPPANPQGKGLTPTISYLQETTSAIRLPPLAEDSAEHLVADLRASQLVLSCRFRFRPVVNRRYHIYRHRDELLLSLVAPEEGGEQIYEHSLGACRLRPDFSWELLDVDFEMLEQAGINLSPGASAAGLESLAEALAAGKVGRYRPGLGYFQNALNFALGKTLGLRVARLQALTAHEQPAGRLEQGAER